MLLERFQVFPNDRSLIGVIFMVLSLGLGGLSYVMYSTPKEEPDFDAKQKSDIAFCKEFGVKKGFEVKREGESVLSMTSAQFDDPKYQFSKVESVILACDNLEMKTFCMGISSVCGLDGTKMVFSYEKPTAY
jgi:hypothetical protein